MRTSSIPTTSSISSPRSTRLAISPTTREEETKRGKKGGKLRRKKGEIRGAKEGEADVEVNETPKVGGNPQLHSRHVGGGARRMHPCLKAQRRECAPWVAAGQTNNNTASHIQKKNIATTGKKTYVVLKKN